MSSPNIPDVNKKIPRSFRYTVTAKGLEIITGILEIKAKKIA